jgi:hypothetical protein
MHEWEISGLGDWDLDNIFFDWENSQLPMLISFLT